MGADLYISVLHKPARRKWHRELSRAARARDRAADQGSRHAAKLRVRAAFERIYGSGYFRDPYNDSDVLWKFGLSWWLDIIPVLDSGSYLTPAKAQWLLTQLQQRAGIFKAALAEYSRDDQEYFRKRAKQLKTFLSQALALNQPILCSL